MAYIANLELRQNSKELMPDLLSKRRAGILVGLFCVYSQKSQGIGDFQDLRLLIDFCHKTGNSLLQLLPMNEVGLTFCPYDALSSFALEPMYLSLEQFPQIEKLKKFFSVRNNYVNYSIKEAKIGFLREIFFQKKETACLTEFRQKNEYWLEDFALYKVLKDYHQGNPWWDWEEKYKHRDPAALKAFSQDHREEIDFQIWLQWLAFRQFSLAKEYANSKQILLKGDLPILVSRDSADVWAHPEFFKLEFVAGAPPDMYCAKGQRWGMPTYNWPAIEADNWRYLKEKLHYAENFYDLLRIDHVVGLFRIWTIPYNEPPETHGLNGFFDPADETKWEGQGRKILSVMLKNTRMCICAEDLGIIPEVCPKTLEDLRIPGNDVQRWKKDWKLKHDFLLPKDYRFLSVAMLSTHDTTNWPAWWENEAGTVDEALIMQRCNERGIDYHRLKSRLFDARRSRHGRLRWREDIDSVKKLVDILGKPKEQLKDFIEFYENSYQEKEKLWRHLGLKGAMRESCDKEILKAALKITLDSRAIFCINTLIDWLFLADIFKGDAYQYRINTPGTISRRNWSLLIPISLEELLNHKIVKEIKKMVESSGRI
ncbi:MAG: 4-alpha-glucanotransferase [Candidatus Omnitrophica bacterium]|nr:4-alpha-glucanotransferase [Candidatus Omnitrophota bacterium]